ncbi:MAG: MBOAT family protein [Flavobacteriales bacterium]|nr:MBOAT family protein [Flavobacteriales bacterium]
MLFNSLDFAIFLPIVFILYWYVFKQLKSQNLLIVLASYVFYGWWDWRFLTLIFFSTILDFTIGKLLKNEQKETRRKLYLWISIIINLGFLGFFKYFNFFIDNFKTAFSFFGQDINIGLLNILLPVGISFYTFQTLSYSIDVYKRKLEPTDDFIAFSAFVSFFPQLVAGPIERATHLLPQFYKKREFNNKLAIEGFNQIIWGLFKKIVIADGAAQYANEIFNNYDNYSSVSLIIGAIYFAFQIYGDFSGYSDIAIGVSKLFGFDLMKNFDLPYFSRDIAEFWRRWHISLNTWFRDYLYIPLGGSRGSNYKVIRNVIIIFIVSGFWHGANWTFIVWGGLNALYFIPLLLLKNNRNNMDIVAKDTLLPSLKELFQIIMTFSLVCFSWIFFRAENVEKAIEYIKKIIQLKFKIDYLGLERYSFEFLPAIFLLILIEWFSRKKEFPLKDNNIILTSFVIICIVLFGSFSNLNSFIYFQF